MAYINDSYLDLIYHGGAERIELPRIDKNTRHGKDFGTGFDCTTFPHQAKQWAKQRGGNVVSVYELNITPDIKVLEFYELSIEWLDFIMACRINKPHSYDIVIGPMADDKVFRDLRAYEEGLINKERFLEMVKFERPTHQILFHTRKSLECITFKEVL